LLEVLGHEQHALMPLDGRGDLVNSNVLYHSSDPGYWASDCTLMSVRFRVISIGLPGSSFALCGPELE